MEARIPEGEPLYMATAELLDWSKGDTDEIYAFKVVRAARYDSLAAELAQWKNDNLEIAGKFTKANYHIRELEADRDQISLTLDVAKADRDKWFNRAKVLEAVLRKCCRVLKDGSFGDAQSVYQEAAALVASAPETEIGK